MKVREKIKLLYFSDERPPTSAMLKFVIRGTRVCPRYLNTSAASENQEELSLAQLDFCDADMRHHSLLLAKLPILFSLGLFCNL